MRTLILAAVLATTLAPHHSVGAFTSPSPVVNGAHFVIDPVNGDNSNTGAPDQPYLSFDALDGQTLVAGTLIEVIGDGDTYVSVGSTQIDINASAGTANEPILIRGVQRDGSDQQVRMRSVPSGTDFLVFASSPTYLTVEGISFSNFGRSITMTTGSNNTIRDCSFISGNDWSVLINGGSGTGTDVYDCLFQNFDSDGINVAGQNDMEIYNCVFRGGTDLADPGLGDCVALHDSNSTRSVVRDCWFFDNKGKACVSFAGSVSGSLGHAHRNFFYNNQMSAIIMASLASWAHNNIIVIPEISEDPGIDINSGAIGCVVTNNLFVNFSENGGTGITMTTGSSASASNNIFWSSGGKNAAHWSSTGVLLTENTCYYPDSLLFGGTGNRLTLSQVVALSADTGSFVADPLLNPNFRRRSGATPSDFTLQAESPCRGVGIDESATVTTDFEKRPRPDTGGDTWDLGPLAYYPYAPEGDGYSLSIATATTDEFIFRDRGHNITITTESTAAVVLRVATGDRGLAASPSKSVSQGGRLIVVTATSPWTITGTELVNKVTIHNFNSGTEVIGVSVWNSQTLTDPVKVEPTFNN